MNTIIYSDINDHKHQQKNVFHVSLLSLSDTHQREIPVHLTTAADPNKISLMVMFIIVTQDSSRMFR